MKALYFSSQIMDFVKESVIYTPYLGHTKLNPNSIFKESKNRTDI